MNWLGRLLHKSPAESELDKELRFHLERQIADGVAKGSRAIPSTICSVSSYREVRFTHSDGTDEFSQHLNLSAYRPSSAAPSPPKTLRRAPLSFS